ncbi:DMT family transporter [Alkalithermobacter paradoxus]|uniref:EamA-like transporter family protein n=1 Tax=Alkalithermobacter paradoxus TaxID=29349 RepID=A0A1V4I8R8_9FIRM|nr:hypothetical protein CLOTH_06640 [[Clostridium] thermoalcaliphilum]
MLYIIISILAGVCVVLSRIVNFSLSKTTGVFQSTFFNYMVGFIFAFIFLFVSGESLNISSLKFESIPYWAYLGGAIGVLIVALSSYITPRISAFYLTLFVFIGQLFVGVAIDYFTLNILSIGKVVGGVLVLIGLAYNLILDKEQEHLILNREQ